MSGTDLDELRHRLRDRTETLAVALLGDPNRAESSRHDMRFGRKGSLSVKLSGNRRGNWRDFSADERGGPFDLIGRTLGLDFSGSLRWAREWLGDPTRHEPPPPRVETPPPRMYERLSPGGTRLWESALPITPDDPAGRYLIGRRCALPGAHAVRWVPSLPHGDDGAFPALLALITDATDYRVPLNLHRTWIALDGSGKAPVDRPRMLLKGHRKAGGVIRLSDDDEVTTGVGVAEGLETALSVLASGWSPIWCVIDAGNLGSFPTLDGIEALTIFADHDHIDPKTGRRPGVHAAETCAARWSDAGKEARVILPPAEGMDANDWACEVANG